jgi:hypothetical protein
MMLFAAYGRNAALNAITSAANVIARSEASGGIFQKNIPT